MPPSLEALGIHRLSVEDRLSLVAQIWASIAQTPEQLPLFESEKQELDRRIAELDANPDEVITWEEIKANLRA